MKSLQIIGAGGHGKVVADTALAIGYDNISFLDEAWPDKKKNGTWNVRGKPIRSEEPMFCAVGDNEARERVFKELDLHNVPVLKHPSTIISLSAEIDQGTLLIAGVIVNADSKIGKGVILNTASSVDHDCIIDDFAHISPGARLAGNVKVGKRSWVGIGAVVREGIVIGDDVIVGAGSVVVHDIENGTTVCGAPARRIK